MNKKVTKMVDELKSKGIKTIIPNAFTAVRLVGSFAIPNQMMKGNTKNAALLAAACGLSDALDGKVARALNAETEFGARFDQVVDKGFAIGVILPLLEKDPKWAAIILSELAIAKTNIEKEMHGIHVKSSVKGKLKTISLFATIAVSYLGEALNINDPKFKTILNSLFGATMAMEIITLTGYMNTNVEVEEVFKEKTLKKEVPSYITIDTSK